MVSPEDSRSASQTASQSASQPLLRTLITANHILHYHSVVDAFGHISVRNPQDPNTFFLSRSLAPALVSSREDLEEYRISDASPVVEKEGKKGYVERYIHSEIYKRYKGVNSVVHAHNEAVLPFSISSVPLQPVFHMAGVCGGACPVYDIARHYKSSDTLHSMLVSNEHLGASLAAGFDYTTMMSKTTSLIKNFVTSQQAQPPDLPSSPVVLMRGHGFTCIGGTIEEAVYRAIFTCTNARVQTTALLMQGSFNVGLMAQRFDRGEQDSSLSKQEGIRYLSDRETKDAWEANSKVAERPWQLWCAEVTASNLYRIELDSA
nr:decarboxylase tropj [Quercus suber]